MRLKQRKEEYLKAVSRLGDALKEDMSNPLIYDGVIQRFEFTYELAWKLIKEYLEYEGLAVVNSPRAAFKEAFASGLLSDGQVWIDMIEARNLSAHTYNEQVAQEIFNMVNERFYPAFADLARRIRGW